MDKDIERLVERLTGNTIAVTYVSPELTLSFQTIVETVLDTRTNEVALLLSNRGRIIASGAQLRSSGNGMILEVGDGKRLYISVSE